MMDQAQWLTSSLIDAAAKRAAEADPSDPRKILLGFLEVMDSLDRLATLAESSPVGTEPAGWAEHLQSLRRQLLSAFESAGVTFFECAGQPFDPARHEAVEMVQRDDVADYTVLYVVARGCEWRGRVLRFARVVVARCSESRYSHQEV